MTYLVLARKWRPRSFDTLVGQDHVVRALTHALSTQRLHHAWLFTGTRGVGKTTLSRILAKALNCETGITATPCGRCQACTEIDAGRFVDYVELDAASNRGVDEMTQLLEQAVYAPSSGRYKVYMIDEVHMLTGHAFNAMLKTLEEPPAHVKFILATTDPQKIPVTVLSRCLQFNLKQMTVPAIVEHLEGVLQQEQIPFELSGLRLLAQAASGSMRDALSLTDQAIAYSAGSLSAEAVQGMLGTIDQGHLCRLLQALSDNDAATILAVADDLAARGLSYAAALADLAVLLSHIAIEQRLPGATPPENPLQADIQSLATRLGPDFIQLFYSIAVHSRNELSLAPDEYAGFVMACLRMLALMPTGADPAQTPPPSSPPTGRPTPPIEPSPAAQQPEPPQAVTPTPTALSTPSPIAVVDQAPDQPAPPVLMVGGTALNGQTAASVSPSSSPEIPAWEDAPAEEVVENAHRPSEKLVTPEDAPQPEPETEANIGSVEKPTSHADVDASSAAPSPATDEPPTGFDDVPFDDEIHYGGDDSQTDEEAMGQGVPDLDPSDVSAVLASTQTNTSTTQKNMSLSRVQAKDWPNIAASLPLSGWAAELARQSEWVGMQDQCVMLRVAIRSADDSQAKTRLTTVLAEYFGEVLRVQIDYGDTGSDTAHAVEQADRAKRQDQAEQDAQVDPFIMALISEFDAKLIEGSVRANHHKAA